MITGAIIRAARGLLRWSADELAARAKLGVATVRRAEQTDGPPAITGANCHAIQTAFAEAGVEFTNGGQPGLRFNRRTAALAAAQAYIVANSDKFTRDRAAPNAAAIEAARPNELRDEANVLQQCRDYRDVEQSLYTLRGLGFVLPLEFVENLEAVFPDHARVTGPATDAVERMDKHIESHKASRKK